VSVIRDVRLVCQLERAGFDDPELLALARIRQKKLRTVQTPSSVSLGTQRRVFRAAIVKDEVLHTDILQVYLNISVHASRDRAQTNENARGPLVSARQRLRCPEGGMSGVGPRKLCV
jgi:hypothetical protein